MLEALLTTLSGVVLLVIGLPALSDIVSVVRSEPSEETSSHSQSVPRFLILVPAHDEELLIGQCVRSLLEARYPEDRRTVVVIADNCSDGTATVARRVGAVCLERNDPYRKGKPHALAWGLERLADKRWDACVVIDADTVVEATFFRVVANAVPEVRDRACQAYFGMLNEDETWLTSLAGVLTRVRYDVLLPLKRKGGLNSPLTGNGMVLGRDLLRRRPWRAFSLTENWELYAEYTAAGETIDFVRDARLRSQEARSLAQGRTQRERWLAGRLTTLKTWFVRLVRSDRIGVHQKLDAIAELANPGPVLQLAIGLGISGLAIFKPPFDGAGIIASGYTVLVISPLLLALIPVLRSHPEPAKVLGALLRLPVYLAWRVAIALATLVDIRSLEWRSTQRHRS